MERYVIRGGKKLSGKVQIQSAKNSVLPMIAGAVLCSEDVVIKNCPKIKDVLVMLEIISALGCSYKFDNKDLVINAKEMNSFIVPSALASELRSSVFMLGALVSRFKKAVLNYPGGCKIGKRPIDLHILALEKLGINTSVNQDEINCTADKISGGEVYLQYPSVGATENLMLASVFASGKTQIHNAAKEPEIVDLMRFLNSMGAKIYGAGTSTILIEGVSRLHGTEHVAIPDRIEQGTFLLATLISGGEVELHNCNAKNISFLIHKFCNNTCNISINSDIIYIKSGGSLKSFSFCTGPYPSFPTDLQAQTMALLSVSMGQSVVTENVFENRFNHVGELVKMGADIRISKKRAFITGVSRLHGAEVDAHDLRGGASLVLAGLNAEGQSVINNVQHIERGYYQFDKKLLSLGADIKKENFRRDI